MRVSSRQGFTLIELLVVISIIALLVGILLPVLGSARSAARELACLTQLRTFNQAMFVYEADNRSLPGWAASITNNNNSSIGGPVWQQTLINGEYIGADATLALFQCPVVFSAAADYLDLRGGNFTNDAFNTNYLMNAIMGGFERRRTDPAVAAGNVEIFIPYSSDDAPETSRTMLTAETAVPFAAGVGSERIATAARSWPGTAISHPKETIGPVVWEPRGLGYLIQEAKGTSNMGFLDGSASAQVGIQVESGSRVLPPADGSGWENPNLILNPFDPNVP